MSGISCKAIGFHLVLPDLTCVFFEKDGQKTSIKVFGSCWPAVKENNTCYISLEASLGFHCAVTLTPPGKAHPIPCVTGGAPSAWPLTGMTCTPGPDRRSGSLRLQVGISRARTWNFPCQSHARPAQTHCREHTGPLAQPKLCCAPDDPISPPKWDKALCFSFNNGTNTIDFSVYRGKEKTTQAKSAFSSTCFKYGMWCVLFLFSFLIAGTTASQPLKPECSPGPARAGAGTAVVVSLSYGSFFSGG